MPFEIPYNTIYRSASLESDIRMCRTLCKHDIGLLNGSRNKFSAEIILDAYIPAGCCTQGVMRAIRVVGLVLGKLGA
jgi:hypothetical protein